LLQLDSLGPKDFERLCYRLICLMGDVVQGRQFGIHGQAQGGIDLYACRHDGSYMVVQCKRSSDGFTPSEITNAINAFLAGEWAGTAAEFVLAVTANLDSTHMARRIEDERARLSSHGITFTVWDSTEISRLLKDNPRLVDDFFGREAVATFLGNGAIRELSQTVDRIFPFEHLDDDATLFGTSEFAFLTPSRQEFLRGEVVSDALAQEVESRLETGWCLVVGKGAAGKTTLALGIGVQHEGSGGRTYFLDFGSISDEGSPQFTATVLEVMSSLDRTSALFILDDIHLNEGLAIAIFEQWKRFRSGSRLLLLGRYATRPRYVNRGRELFGHQTSALVMHPTREGFAATYRRVAKLANSANVPDPPADIVSGWLDLFGGDRIAFSVAVANKLRKQPVDQWISRGGRLEAGDAVFYIKERYIQSRPRVLPELLKLATCGALTIAVQERAIDREALAVPLRDGIVYRISRDRYRLAHPGLGALIIAAAQPLDDLPILTQVAEASPYDGHLIASRLADSGRTEAATSILRRIPQDAMSLTLLLARPTASQHLSRLARSGILSYAQMDERLGTTERLIPLCRLLLEQPHINLITSLKFITLRLPRVTSSLAILMARPENAARLADSIANARRPGAVAGLLRLLSDRLPTLVAPLGGLLSENDRATQLAETISTYSSLGRSAAFLQLTFARMPHVAGRFAEPLSEHTVAARLADTICATANLGDATAFLKLSMEYMPEVANQLGQVLAEPHHIAALADSIVSTNAGTAASFIQLAFEKMPLVANRLATSLAEPYRHTRLADSIVASIGPTTPVLKEMFERLPTVAERLTKLLAERDRAGRLADAITGAPNYGEAAAFVEFAHQHMPVLVRQLADLMTEPQRTHRIAGTVTANRVDTAPLLGQMFDHMPRAYEQLTMTLGEPGRCATLADAIAADIGTATPLIKLIFECSPHLAQQLTMMLREPGRCATLADAIAADIGTATPLVKLIFDHSSRLAKQLATLLAEPNRTARLADNLVATTGGQGYSWSFLRFAHQRAPRLANQLVKRLAEPGRVTALADNLAAAPNSRPATSVLRWSVEPMRPIADRVAELLAEPDRAAQLADGITTDLGLAAAFIKVTFKNQPRLADHLAVLLAQPGRVARLTDLVVAGTSLPQTENFLNLARRYVPQVTHEIAKLAGASRNKKADILTAAEQLRQDRTASDQRPPRSATSSQ
jgi:hypothetical protein